MKKAFTLDGGWQLQSLSDPTLTAPITLPGDVHSALLDAALIPHPYWGCNERDVQWVSEHDWQVSREFEVSEDLLTASAIDLCLQMVDTVADVYINNTPVLACRNMFRLYQQDVRSMLVAGKNHIRIVFKRADLEAAERASALPFPVPWAVGNNQVPHMNTLRKTQCHAGWDWGICLIAAGIYESIALIPRQQCRLQNTTTTQTWTEDACRLDIAIEATLLAESPVAVEVSLTSPAGERIITTGTLTGETLRVSLDIDSPCRWWPAGYGEQPLYTLCVSADGQQIEKRIGLRELVLETLDDEVGQSMTFVVNGVPIMAKGANWIPLDAMPGTHSPERYRQLLEDAVDANMNMIRVWGGGMYERDCFYQLCDELGLLVWQDLMFACALYPSTDAFLDDVELEVVDQVRRLRDHASLALWCGDNEVIGAIGWYPESRQNREKYVVNYDRLNRVLEQAVRREDPSRRFWASSPCNGELDFGDAWHDDNKGDMHFWDVWHSGKSLDAYHSIKPRFCSEFGYQSWPSLPTVKTFAEQEDWNVTSPTFEQHQKNGRGNSIITEMFTRYFRFPASFAQMLYLSQVQQALAIKTASEYWRANKPICRGILYWQLNDCWPVSSWSSIEYTGRWKQLHYHAKRFFAPQLATFVSDEQGVRVQLVNDAKEAVSCHGVVRHIDWHGVCRKEWRVDVDVAADGNETVWQCDTAQREANLGQGFYHVTLQCDDEHIENTWFDSLFKQLPLVKTEVFATVRETEQGVEVTLTADSPAFFVTLESEYTGRFSDNSVTLLPNEPKVLTYHGPESAEALQASLAVYHLAASY
ncbi:beta-mannosidase [Thaumasiovibrio subtropicus]|uniref:beta-mannosidase n=1 Tax=Thaumasiovibrio subtropicus TaxID=1891207 RepID=UPI000B362439|nr:glycoside hydrolase family 2 protein [Thaumasiovibrio subtropicus]